jgi:hypothetical protein
MSPQELLATFADRGIVLEEQPHVFDSILPPDRRRFCSQPGGLPSGDALGPDGARRSIVELERGDLALELGQVLLSARDVLVDIAPRLGCVCAGASALGAESTALDARTRLTALEPPRAPQPVVEFRPDVELELAIAAPVEPRGHAEIATSLPVTRRADMRSAEPHPARVALPPDAVVPGARRRSPSRGIRALSTLAPAAREAGARPLPRAYVAHRRSSPRGLHAITESIVESAPAVSEPVTSAEPAPAPATEPPSISATEPSAASAEPSSKPAAQAPQPAPATREGEPARLALLVAILVLVSAVIGVVIGRLTR